MASTIRVMIVDDSLIVRRLVEDSLREVEGITVVGTAANGRIALERVGALAPDVVTLDVEMPELDGLATLRKLRAAHPRVHVIMFSSLTTRAAATTVEALSIGAADYVAKPSSAGGMSATRALIREQLVPKIRGLCARVEVHALPRPTVRALPVRGASVVAIGASTGGPAVLQELLSLLPPAVAPPMVIVQHVPAAFSAPLAERLSSTAGRRVTEVRGRVALAPGQIWLAPGDRHVIVRRRGTSVELELDDGEPEGSCRPSVDVLFRSVAEAYGADALAVVLTGMGHDGVRGCEALHAVGARVIVQDAASCVVWGMPGAVARAGLADGVFDVRGLAHEIAGASRARMPTIEVATRAGR
jgi:two-component system chemotaxis response regulator CheB